MKALAITYGSAVALVLAWIGVTRADEAFGYGLGAGFVLALIIWSLW